MAVHRDLMYVGTSCPNVRAIDLFQRNVPDVRFGDHVTCLHLYNNGKFSSSELPGRVLMHLSPAVFGHISDPVLA